MEYNHISAKNSSAIQIKLENFKNSRIIHNSSPYKTSSYPKVYLSSNLQEKIKKFKKIQSILDSPQKIPRKTRQTSVISKPNKTPKLYLLVSSTPNYIAKLSHDAGCSCCNQRSLSFEASFDKVIQEKKQKTNVAKEDFKRLCTRPKTAWKDLSYSQINTSISENPDIIAHNIKKITIKARCQSRKVFC